MPPRASSPLTAWSVLRDLEGELAGRASSRWLASDPLASDLDAVGRRCLVDDARRHLSHLAQAVRVEQPAIFVEYVDWGRSLLDAIGVPSASFARQLELLDEAIEGLAPQIHDAVRPTLQQGLAVLGASGAHPPSPLGESVHPELARAVTEQLIAGDRTAAGTLLAAVVRDGLTVQDIYLEVIQPCLREVGRRWQLRQITVAEEHLATAGAQYLLATIFQQTIGTAGTGRGRLLATSVGGNLHDIGVRMVADLFTLEGWDATYLGASTPTQAVVSLAVSKQVDLVAISVTMIDQLDEVEHLVAAVQARCDAKVIVGGRPFLLTPELATIVGADGTATDARQATELGQRLVPAGPTAAP